MYKTNRNIAGFGTLGVVWTLQKFLMNYDVASEVFYMPDISFVPELKQNAYLVKTIPDRKWWYVVPEKPSEIGEVQTQSFIGYLEQGWAGQDAFMEANNLDYSDMVGFITPFPKHLPGLPELTPIVPTSGTTTEIPFTEIPTEQPKTELPKYTPPAGCLTKVEIQARHGLMKQIEGDLFQTSDGMYWKTDRQVVNGVTWAYYYCPVQLAQQPPEENIVTNDCDCDCEELIETEKWVLTPFCTGENCYPVQVKVRKTICEGGFEGSADFNCDEIENIVQQMNR